VAVQKPDIILEIQLPFCPTPEARRRIEDIARDAAPLGDAGRSLTICSDRPGFGDKVLSVGLWADDGGASDAEFSEALVAASPLTPDQGAALLFTPAALQRIATLRWSQVPKKQEAPVGFVRLRDDISVVIRDGAIVTTVKGEWKKRFAPNISFTVTVRDVLKLRTVRIPGLDPPLKAAAEKSINPNTIKWAVLGTLVSPLLGGLIFWQGDNVVEGLAPTPPEGAGGALAARWPGQIMTEINPREGLLGKFLFTWTVLEVDSTGVRTLGAFSSASRVPTAFIEGPPAISVELPAHSARKTYRLIPVDLRGNLKIRWRIDSVPAGRARRQAVDFETPGLDPGSVSRRLRVEVEDVDELTARSNELTVRFETKVPPGKQPF
jgi:hypothetical protein